MLSFVVVGCGDEKLELKNKEVVPTEDTIEESGEKDNKVDFDKKLGFTTQEIMDLDLFKDVDKKRLKAYSLENGLTIEAMHSNNISFSFFAYFLDNSNYPSAFFIRNTGNNTDLSFEMLEVFYSKYNDEEKEVIEVLKDESENYHLVGFIFNEELNHSEIPFSFPDITKDDFFVKGIEKDIFDELNNSANYDELIRLTDQYIKENDVKDYDSVNDVAEVLEPIRNQLDKVKIMRDDFDNSATIYYNSLTSITKSNYVVPFISTNERYMEMFVGFEKDNWLFAEEYSFNVDGEIYDVYDAEFERDTLGGSKIREVDTADYGEEYINAILTGEDVKLRFKGSKGNLDYTLTDVDKEAINVINSFNEVHHNLSDLIFEFYN